MKRKIQIRKILKLNKRELMDILLDEGLPIPMAATKCEISMDDAETLAICWNEEEIV